jgi:hypothetical protein
MRPPEHFHGHVVPRSGGKPAMRSRDAESVQSCIPFSVVLTLLKTMETTRCRSELKSSRTKFFIRRSDSDSSCYRFNSQHLC